MTNESCVWSNFRLPWVVKMPDSVATLGVLCEEGNSSTSNTVVSGPELSSQETVARSSVLHEEGNSCPGPSREREERGVMSLAVH